VDQLAPWKEGGGRGGGRGVLLSPPNVGKKKGEGGEGVLGGGSGPVGSVVPRCTEGRKRKRKGHVPVSFFPTGFLAGRRKEEGEKKGFVRKERTMIVSVWPS